MSPFETLDFSLEQIQNAKQIISNDIVTTPVHRLRGLQLEKQLGLDTEVFLKLELLQVTGTFKARGALHVMRHLSKNEPSKGVTAVSAGNHAIAVAYAAKALGVDAKVVMLQSANAFRVSLARAYGAKVEMAPDGKSAFARVEEIQQKEERSFIHPFEGVYTSLATATIGLEWCQQVSDMDAIIVPIGGGGLMSGIAAAVKTLSPKTKIFGVEPVGAAIMHQSFRAGKPTNMSQINTIADSLAPPMTTPLSYALCKKHVDQLVLVSDDEIRRAMVLLCREAKLIVEPAGAAATAALCGPLQKELQGKRVGVIVCGSNIDLESFQKLIKDTA